MNRFKKIPLYAAIAAVGSLGITDATLAVNIGFEGHGQVLLYPYYTTRADMAGNAYATLFTVTNSTSLAKALAVRFYEGRNGRLVLGFHVFLSPFDVWTATVLPDLATGSAKVGTLDATCTLPPFSTSLTAPFVSFVNYAYTGNSSDAGGSSLDRTKEGYFEIIEMATFASSSTTGKAVTHVNGVPPCGSNLNNTQAAIDAQPLGGGLYGSAVLINVSSGTDITAEPFALDNFFSGGPNYIPSGLLAPDLTQANPPLSAVVTANGSIYVSLWSPGTADPVSAVLMHNSLLNDYVLDTVTKSSTDWVLTFPTKRFYTALGSGNASKLFERNFSGTAGSCDDISLDIWDGDEKTQATSAAELCWASNVIRFNGSNVLGSSTATSVASPYQQGWAKLAFPPGIGGPGVHWLINTGATSITAKGGATTTGNTVSYVGLPVIGFAAMSTSGTLQIGNPSFPATSSNGTSYVHKTYTDIR
jgi:hypothetical protein